MQRHVRTVVVIGLTVGLMAFFLRNADLRGVWGAIADARLDFLSGALLLTVATYVVRVMRWRYLLRPVGRVGFNAAFRAVVMGFAATSVLPGRVGELLRPYVLARTARLSASATFGTVVVERLLDLIAILLLFGISVVMFESGRQALDSRLLDAVQVGAGVAGTGALVMLVVAYLAAGHPGRVGRVIARTAGLLPSHMAQALSASARRFTTGLAITRQASTLLVAMAWSVFLWGCSAASLWLVTTAFAIAPPAIRRGNTACPHGARRGRTDAGWDRGLSCGVSSWRDRPVRSGDRSGGRGGTCVARHLLRAGYDSGDFLYGTGGRSATGRRSAGPG